VHQKDTIDITVPLSPVITVCSDIIKHLQNKLGQIIILLLLATCNKIYVQACFFKMTCGFLPGMYQSGFIFRPN